jgi:hypothetical protein
MEHKLVWPLGGEGTGRDGDLGMLLVSVLLVAGDLVGV